jgi:SAM-dependent methyltransferase
MKKPSYIRYPIYARDLTLIEKVALRTKALPIKCTVCGSFSIIRLTNNNFRENCYCVRCGSFNRQRQIAYVLCQTIPNKKVNSLNDLASMDYLSIYNTEAGGTLHRFLRQINKYVCSEYFGDQYKGGDYIDGRMHQDLMCLSFPDNQFDYVISTDVFEHIADPYVAHQEVHRVLKPGGRHIFTIPFYQTDTLDEKRAAIDEKGELVHYKEPMYHIDPIRPEGVLVFNIFSIEMLVKLRKMGFRTNMHHMYRPSNGILGPNGLVFEAIKETPQV